MRFHKLIGIMLGLTGTILLTACSNPLEVKSVDTTQQTLTFQLPVTKPITLSDLETNPTFNLASGDIDTGLYRYDDHWQAQKCRYDTLLGVTLCTRYQLQAKLKLQTGGQQLQVVVLGKEVLSAKNAPNSLPPRFSINDLQGMLQDALTYRFKEQTISSQFSLPYSPGQLVQSLPTTIVAALFASEASDFFHNPTNLRTMIDAITAMANAGDYIANLKSHAQLSPGKVVIATLTIHPGNKPKSSLITADCHLYAVLLPEPSVISPVLEQQSFSQLCQHLVMQQKQKLLVYAENKQGGCSSVS